jgi:hypothetical protein
MIHTCQNYATLLLSHLLTRTAFFAQKTVYKCVYIVILENHWDNLFVQDSPQKQLSPTMLFSEVVAVTCHKKLKHLCLSGKTSTVYKQRSQISSSTHSHKMSKPVFTVHSYALAVSTKWKVWESIKPTKGKSTVTWDNMPYPDTNAPCSCKQQQWNTLTMTLGSVWYKKLHQHYNANV